MTHNFVCFKNAAPVNLGDVPVLAIPAWRRFLVDGVCSAKGRVVALFADDCGDCFRLYGLIGIDGHGELRLAAGELAKTALSYPSLAIDLPQTQRFERELFEEHGIVPEGHPGLKPLRVGGDYPYYRMAGDEIHEVAVGPVHAGIIEPGHFRFQCHGEKVFHLEIRLGYQHRGITSMFPKAKPQMRAVLAESIAGDTVVGHALAYAQTEEGLAGRAPTARANALRAIALELERVANHVGDLGMLSADIGFLSAAAWFGRLRGEFLNLMLELTGNRYGRSFIRPGGVLADLPAGKKEDFQKRLATGESEFRELTEFFFATTSVLDRFEQTGVITADTAQKLGLVGPAARASGLNRDVRGDYPTGAYRSRNIPAVRLTTGDVYARARVRSLEVKRALEFLKGSLASLTEEKVFATFSKAMPASLIVSLIEGWRGEIAHIAATDSAGEIRMYKIIDPSFHNWTGLEMAMRDGQISDFPLCNKSFNLSYAGHDL